jgi:hypothetical protein
MLSGSSRAASSAFTKTASGRKTAKRRANVVLPAPFGPATSRLKHLGDALTLARYFAPDLSSIQQLPYRAVCASAPCVRSQSLDT